jgi:hypothetical protein
VNGAIGLAVPPVLQPVADRPGQYEVRATFRRLIVPVPEVRAAGNRTPQFYVHQSCPALRAELEASFLVTPVGAPLGAKLGQIDAKVGTR